jgi:hypothetical protein
MFDLVVNNFTKDITCTKTANLISEDFRWYDKDGFELCAAEKKLYAAMNFPLTECLYHLCWQDTWMNIQHPKFILDHCMLLHRCDFAGDAKNEITGLMTQNPKAQMLLKSKKKWGFDFALDYIDDRGSIWEIVHIEWDSYHFNEIVEMKESIQEKILSTDWESISKHIIAKESEWSNLEGFKQNDWKAKEIFGWTFAERTLKSL